ncbi:MAG: ABC transporter permease subunit, partial [Planctomycetota bacterium]
VDFDARAMAAAIGAMLLLAATLLTLCTLVVRRVHLRSAGRGAGPVKAERTGKAVTLRTPSDRRPLVWKEMHAASIRTPSRTWRGRAIRVAGWLLVVGVSVTPVVFFWLSLLTFGGGRGFGGRTPTLEEYVATTATIAAVLGSLMAIGAGARASGLIAHERERDTWLTLLTTPATASDIFYAKLIGNLWAFRWPAALVVALPTLGVVLGPGALWAAASIGVAVAVTTTAASAIGLAISLRCKSSTKASTLTVLALFALSGLYPAFAGALLGLAGAGRDAVWLLVTPAVVPFLIGAPPMLAIDSPEPLMVGSVAIGLTGYTAVAWLVSIAAVADFDRVCQRGRRRDKPAERAEGPEGGAAAA